MTDQRPDLADLAAHQQLADAFVTHVRAVLDGIFEQLRPLLDAAVREIAAYADLLPDDTNQASESTEETSA